MLTAFEASQSLLEGTDEEEEGVWKTFNGDHVLEEFAWGPSEPNLLGGGEDCIIIMQGRDAGLVDITCETEFDAVVCERILH